MKHGRKRRCFFALRMNFLGFAFGEYFLKEVMRMLYKDLYIFSLVLSIYNITASSFLTRFPVTSKAKQYKTSI